MSTPRGPGASMLLRMDGALGAIPPVRSSAPQLAGSIPRGTTLRSTTAQASRKYCRSVSKEHVAAACGYQTGGLMTSPVPDVATRITSPGVRDHSAIEGEEPRLQARGVLEGSGTSWYPPIGRDAMGVKEVPQFVVGGRVRDGLPALHRGPVALLGPEVMPPLGHRSSCRPGHQGPHCQVRQLVLPPRGKRSERHRRSAAQHKQCPHTCQRRSTRRERYLVVPPHWSMFVRAARPPCSPLLKEKSMVVCTRRTGASWLPPAQRSRLAAWGTSVPAPEGRAG